MAASPSTPTPRDQLTASVSPAGAPATVHATPDRWPRRAVWLALTLGLAIFVAFGRVPLLAGDDAGQVRRLTRIWSSLVTNLPESSNATLLKYAFLLVLSLCLVGIIAALWLALAADDQSDAA